MVVPLYTGLKTGSISTKPDMRLLPMHMNSAIVSLTSYYDFQ